MSEVIGYILTGGKNRRMDGKIKFFLEYQGSCFGERVAAALEGCKEIYLSVNERGPYEDLGLPLVLDEYEAIGPMGGILSGMRNLPGKDLLVVSSDMPFLEKAVIEKLMEVYLENPVLTICQAEGRLYPFPGIYPGGLLPLLEKLAAEGTYRMGSIRELTDYQTVTVPKSFLQNINSWEEYKILTDAER